MSENAKATINLVFYSENQVNILWSALSPETKALPTRRISIKLEKNSNCLVLVVEAEDTVALRATLNSYLRWIGSTLSVLEVIQKN
ncbi:MAG: hypothetical protein GX799_01990 [Crenarchaeota archaeon]|jgi:KEOPS complex subunit Pcc1|nr:hypothetical protein [Thermoproteota archaeon]